MSSTRVRLRKNSDCSQDQYHVELYHTAYPNVSTRSDVVQIAQDPEGKPIEFDVRNNDVKDVGAVYMVYPDHPDATKAIVGHLVNIDTHQPLGGATVNLMFALCDGASEVLGEHGTNCVFPSENNKMQRLDANGRFSFTNLVPWIYRLSATYAVDSTLPKFIGVLQDNAHQNIEDHVPRATKGAQTVDLGDVFVRLQ